MHPTLILDSITIRTDADGRYCLNDLHKAAGEEGKHQPSNFLRLDSTKALIEEIDRYSEVRNALQVIQGGHNQGTYVAKELVYAYAMWISPAFHLKVIRAYDTLVTQPQPINPAQLSRMQLIEMAMDAERERLVLAEKVEQMLPKAEGFDRIAGAEGSLCLRDAAKELQFQPKQLNLWLQANKWIYKRAGGSNFIGYQDRIQAGLLEHKSSVVIDGAGNERLRDQVRITGKGLARLAKELANDHKDAA